MSELLSKLNKQFNKQSFKNGMVVELDTGRKRLYWEGRLIDEHGYIPLCYYDEDLRNTDNINNEDNIDKVFTARNVGYFSDFFSDRNLTEIWSRY
jgi:hypothetical protein